MDKWAAMTRRETRGGGAFDDARPGDSPRRLRVAGQVVADYVVEPDVELRLSPRPYLHPVRTLSGVLVSDALPVDHPHHLGVSVAVQDVDETNLWGGRTYVRGRGYTWLDDHGRIVHDGFDVHEDDRLVERLRWCDRSGETLLAERRVLTAHLLEGTPDGWVLGVSFGLTAPRGRVTLGSPATNGREAGSGYGGLFWRAPAGELPPDVLTATADGEDAANGSTEPWLAMTTDEYSLVFTGLGPGDHWFVRAAGYPGVCAALAYTQPVVVSSATPVERHYEIAVVGERLDRTAAAAVAQRLRDAATPGGGR